MQQDGIQLNNTAVMSGLVATDFTFSHEVYGEGFYQFQLEVNRLSSASDQLPVTISERLAERQQFPRGTPVHITGQIRSYNNYVENSHKNRLILTLFTRDIINMSEKDILQPAEHLNDIFLDGFICKPPIYRTTPFGREIADLLLAVNRSYNKSDYIPCIAWGRNARFAGKLTTGDHIRIWGRMQSRNYQKKLEDGLVLDKTAYEVSICKMEQVSSDSDINMQKSE